MTNLPVQQQVIRAKCIHPTGLHTAFEREEIEQSIPGRFEKQVAKYPDRLAVKTRCYNLTYMALNQTANRLAHTVRAQHTRGGEPIALLLGHDAPLIAAMLAVLKTGKGYVALDPAYPQHQLTAMLADAQAALIVTDAKHLPITHALTPHGCQVLNIDECDLLHSSPENLGLSLSPDTLANIMYTSGSTGQSKGVVQNHRNLLHKAMLYTNDLHLCVEDGLSLLHSCSFAASLRHIWGALLNGAALFPFDLQTEGLINIAPWLLEERITICHIPASVFRYFAGLLRGKDLFPALRVLYVANEPVSRHDVELYQAHFSSRCLFVNALVASEALTMRQFFIDKATPVHESIVPVGYPVQDEEIVLLDEDGQEVGTNHVGEIAVKSRYLALGYWQKPELTRATFVPDRDDASKRLYQTGDLGRMLADGCLVYLGRKDFQVKISGRWIDVAEIEMALLDHAAVKAAVVVAGERHPDDTRLIAYIVPAQAPGPTIGELQRFLHARLPEYMMPSTFVLLDALPLTPTGKVDRLALPMPDPVRPALDTAFVAPHTPIEEVVARIWAEVLGLEQVGMHDNFLALGGHSLLATQVLSRLREALQVELPLRRFFEDPTIAGVAVAVTQWQTEQLASEAAASIVAELEALSPTEVQSRLANEAQS